MHEHFQAGEELLKIGLNAAAVFCRYMPRKPLVSFCLQNFQEVFGGFDFLGHAEEPCQIHEDGGRAFVFFAQGFEA